MRKILLLSFLTSAIYGIGQTRPALIVDAGMTVTLPPQTFIYSEINIKNGGTLVINPKSANWLILYCEGNVTINGTITYRGFKSGNSSTYMALTPDGETLSHTFTEGNKGGNGGHGGSSACTLRGGGSVYQPGGREADGTTSYGGGGGAGGGLRTASHCTDQVTPGHDAVNQNGGTPSTAGFDSPRGGDGAIKNTYVNGGLLYIFCKGDFNGSGGVIDVRGTNGDDGKPGLDNTLYVGIEGGQGGGGGGGGAPGGEGGKVIFKVKGSVQMYPSLLVEGGIGGQGGNGGRGFSNIQNIPTSYGGKGKDGEAGQNGTFEIRH